MLTRRFAGYFLTTIAMFQIGGIARAAVVTNTVHVGNAGNGPDARYSYGAVAYEYDIGRCEVSNADYCEFLNAKAKNRDPYGLYNIYMTEYGVGGIVRSGDPANYSYSVKPGYEKLPVNEICWYDALRYANWLTNGRGQGDTESGSYAIAQGGANSGIVALPGVEQRAAWAAGTKQYWLLPSENEWYKAAYHKNDGPTANYWTYATGTDEMPHSDNPDSLDFPTNSANVRRTDELANGYDDGFAVTGSTNYDPSYNYLTSVDAYSQSLSPYGTLNQSGNVLEWTETVAYGSTCCIRGGYWYGNYYMAASQRYVYSSLADESPCLGFRVVSVPEPQGLMLIFVGLLTALAYARRR